MQRNQALTRLVLGGLAVICLNGLARAELRFEQPAAEAGQVLRGAPLTHYFAFVNAGKETVEITAVRASCGCLKPEVTRTVLAPGESGRIDLKVNTLGEAAGDHLWKVHVAYRQGTVAAETTLELKGSIKADLSVQPAHLVVYAGAKVGHEIVLTDFRAKPLTITAVRPSLPGLRTKVKEVARDKDGHVVQTVALDVTDAFADGRHDGVIGIYTDDPSYPELNVRVSVIKRGRQRVGASPGAVVLEGKAGQPIASKLVLLRDRDGEPVVIDRVQADDPAITCQFSRGANPTATVRVAVDPKRLQDVLLSTTVTVEISKPVRETLTVPVTCTVR